MQIRQYANRGGPAGRLLRAGAAVGLLLLAVPTVWAQADEFAIDWFTVDGGGGTSTDDVFSVSGTIGQCDAGEQSDDVFTVTGGFWGIPEAVTPPAEPGLTIVLSGNDVVISWPVTSTNFVLEQNPSLFDPNGWTAVGLPVVVTDGRNVVTVPASGELNYYRLNPNPSPPAQFLTIVSSGTDVIISWPVTATNFVLEQNPSLSDPNGWTPVGQSAVVVNNRNTVTIPATAPMAFYRLVTTPAAPELTIVTSGTNVIISWPAPSTGYSLEQNTSLFNSSGWSMVGLPVVVTDGQNTVTAPGSDSPTYYRLTQSPHAPTLALALNGSDVTISWAVTPTSFTLQQTADLNSSNWANVTNTPTVVDSQYQVTVSPTNDSEFYRLKYP